MSRVPQSTDWPPAPKKVGDVLGFLKVLLLKLAPRDRQLAVAINQGAAEVVTSEPSGTPEGEAPQVRFYKYGSTWRMYVWCGAGEGWHYWNMDA